MDSNKPIKIVINKTKDLFNLSEEAFNYLQEKYNIDKKQARRLERHDLRLVEVIEKLKNNANASNTQLEINVINSNKYCIEYYNGVEYLMTPNEINWITIK